MKQNWTPGLLAEFEEYEVSVDAESSLGNRLAGWHVLGNPEAGNGEMFVVLHFDGTPEEEYDANSERLKACWNAMVGIPDPAAYVAAMGACVEALADLRSIVESGLDPTFQVLDRCDQALQAARAAVGDAALTNPPHAGKGVEHG